AIFAAIAGVVATYSLVYYLQEHHFRELNLLFLGINVIILSFLYMATHPAFSAWSSFFVSRERNQTILSLLGLAMIPGVLSGTLTAGQITKGQRTISIIWGGIILPSLALVFFFIPTPLFMTYMPGVGITFYGIALVFAVSVSFLAALAKYLRAWKQERNRIDLASALALLLWFWPIVLFAIQTESYQASEIVSFLGMIMGFLLLGIAMVTVSVAEPYRILEVIVAERTKQLELSRQESEYYLNMWSHEIGNLLQSMLTYVEIMADGFENKMLKANTRDAALELSKKIKFILGQVAKLTRIKEGFKTQPKPVELIQVLNQAVRTIREMGEEREFSLTIPSMDRETWMLADDLGELIFVNIIIHFIENGLTENPTILVNVEDSPLGLAVHIKSEGRELPRDVQESLIEDLNPSKTALGLGLFTVRLLMEHYGGSIEYHRFKETSENLFVLHLMEASRILS
ncbi:MAG: hypothetical protein KAU48_05675, partial [Candidatus Thorarchaeota archaeon]|nr:hypothetical protein [Candidatus Thorarchaeota archaeon]